MEKIYKFQKNFYRFLRKENLYEKFMNDIKYHSRWNNSSLVHFFDFVDARYYLTNCFINREMSNFWFYYGILWQLYLILISEMEDYDKIELFKKEICHQVRDRIDDYSLYTDSLIKSFREASTYCLKKCGTYYTQTFIDNLKNEVTSIISTCYQRQEYAKIEATSIEEDNEFDDWDDDDW